MRPIYFYNPKVKKTDTGYSVDVCLFNHKKETEIVRTLEEKEYWKVLIEARRMTGYLNELARNCMRSVPFVRRRLNDIHGFLTIFPL